MLVVFRFVSIYDIYLKTKQSVLMGLNIAEEINLLLPNKLRIKFCQKKIVHI